MGDALGDMCVPAIVLHPPSANNTLLGAAADDDFDVGSPSQIVPSFGKDPFEAFADLPAWMAPDYKVPTVDYDCEQIMSANTYAMHTSTIAFTDFKPLTPLKFDIEKASVAANPRFLDPRTAICLREQELERIRRSELEDAPAQLMAFIRKKLARTPSQKARDLENFSSDEEDDLQKIERKLDLPSPLTPLDRAAMSTPIYRHFVKMHKTMDAMESQLIRSSDQEQRIAKHQRRKSLIFHLLALLLTCILLGGVIAGVVIYYYGRGGDPPVIEN
ncbi:uncharacterized protein V1510DRAFT_411387 [Dipodascopsis tothii]|uniref:uncharacterized protein n=1 Tax=Dipodascopsis tothii TaxID=44089 RepID=UPI0034CD10C1